MKKFLFLSLILSSLWFLSSCESNAEMEEIPGGFVCKPDISYASVISPIISQNCKPCHFDGSQLPDLSNYNSISTNADLIKSVTQNKSMPKNGSLTQDEIDAIACWIDNGALNN